MRYLVLACDYDGTLATHGLIDDPTIVALDRCKQSGRRLILVTGRELSELLPLLTKPELFDCIVAENGAILYRPSDKSETILVEPPPASFVEALRARGVAPISVGRVIVATWEPHQTTVLDTIREQGLELQVIFNKGAVMVLPSGVNKCTGLLAALAEMHLSPHNVVAVGDAENDHALLKSCEASAAVGNALQALKETADIVTAGTHGTGVTELIEQLVANDLSELDDRLSRHQLLLGRDEQNREVRIVSHRNNILVCGAPSSGISTLASTILEQMADKTYQFCIIDLVGDFEEFEPAVIVGNRQQPPSPDEVGKLLEKPHENVGVNMIAVPANDRPALFRETLARIQRLRARLGHPHWVLVDEAHHVLPATGHSSTLGLPGQVDRVIYVTPEPNLLAPSVLATIDTVIAVGKNPHKTISNFCEIVHCEPPSVNLPDQMQPGEAVVWHRRTSASPFVVIINPPRAAVASDGR